MPVSAPKSVMHARQSATDTTWTFVRDVHRSAEDVPKNVEEQPAKKFSASTFPLFLFCLIVYRVYPSLVLLLVEYQTGVAAEVSLLVVNF